MPSNALIQKTFDATLRKLNGESEIVDSPRDGVSLIDDWLTALHDAPQANRVAQDLAQLRSLVQMPNPDTDQLKMLLQNLADNTTQLAQSNDGPWVNQLEELTVALRTFSTQL